MCVDRLHGAMGRSEHAAAVDAFVDRVEAADVPALDRLVLFGSVARGDHRADSDVDVLAILDDVADPSAVEERLRDIAYDVMLDRGVAISVHAVTTSRLAARDDHPFFETVMSEGRPIYG